jgi:DNA-binding CsgD family transcriptional regulator
VLPGRADEASRIERLLDGARSGVSAALIVHGEAGIGKTALLDEIASAAVGFTILRAKPLQMESELPFAGLSDLLRPLLPLLDRIPEPQAAALAGALAFGSPTPGDRFAAAAATISLLAVGAEEAPVLGVVDDAHWLDGPSREALLFAGRRLGREGVVLLLASRDSPWLEGAGIDRLELRGLGPEAAATLVGRTGRVISAAVRDRLVGETGGNPLALLEAIATLTDAQLRGLTPIVEPIAVGRSVEQTFVQRLEPLPDTTRRALLIASASYSGDADEVARALKAMGLAMSDLDPAEQIGLVAPRAGRVEFRHPLVRSAAYHDADPAARRAAHRALAGALEPDQFDRIAWHLAAAAAGPDEEVARLLEVSATAAHARRGYVAAANALASAAHLSPTESGRIRRTIAAADAYRLGGEAEKAADILARILHLASDPLLRADIQQLRSAALIFVSPTMDIYRLLVDEAGRVESVDPTRAATMLALATGATTAAAEVDLTVATARRAVHLSRDQGARVEMLTALTLATGLTLAGRVGEAREILDPLIPVLDTIDPLGEAGALLVTVPGDLVWIGDTPAARRLLERIISHARSASAITMLPYPLAILSELEFHAGRMALAYASAAEAVQLATETGQPAVAAFSLVTLARVEALRGFEAECRDHVAAALEVARRLGTTSIENYAASVLGALELSLGHPEAAVVHLAECARLEDAYGLRMPDVVPWNGDLVEAYVRTGQTGLAVREVETLEEQGRTTGSRWATATAARCRGLLADEDGYEDLLVKALELHGDEYPFERARTELSLGRRRRHSRRRAAARVVLHQALATFEVLGAELWAQQAWAELRATGETPAPRPGGSLMRLTPQELQVALIVADGATNKEAAAALFISPKTVEFHLGHVYSKLGVRSRTELVPRIAALS